MSLISEEDYVEMEKNADCRHEYVDGYIYAMAGSSRPHNKIALNIGVILHQQVKGTPYGVYMSDNNSLPQQKDKRGFGFASSE